MITDAGYVYAIGFSNGDVKVGRTQHIRTRLRTHKRSARRAGLAVADCWVSPLHVEWDINEDTLKQVGIKLGGTPVSAEYFTGLDWSEVVGMALRLPFTPPFEVPADSAGGSPQGFPSAREQAIRGAALDAQDRELATDLPRAAAA